MTDEQLVPIDVELPPELLTEMDAYAVQHGYATQSGVVRRALERADG